MKKILLTPPRPQAQRCPIIVDSGALGEIPRLVGDMHDVDRCIVLYDVRLKEVAEAIVDALPDAHGIAVPSGEESKSLLQVERIAQDMLLKHVTRNSILINIGGGMLTDLGGFVASVFMRGIRFINVPTSLLGMMDAAIGGKTGVDLGPMKNMIGTITHPSAVVIDTDTLTSLPDEQLREGLVEVVKKAAILDAEFFGWLEENMDAVLDRKESALNVCIQNGARMKAEVVGKDDRDANHRLLLNFGHTVGHAVEAMSRFSLSHGKAVSIGMVCEMKVAETKEQERVVALLKQLDMPLDVPIIMKNDELWDIMKNDKKTVGDDVRIAIPTELGRGNVRSMTFAEFKQARD